MHAAWRLWLAVAVLFSIAHGEEEDKPPVEPEDDVAGDVSRELTPDQMLDLHSKMDANGDGKTSLEEIMAFADVMRTETSKKYVVHIVEELDSDKDGKISLQELLKDMEYEGESEEEKAESQKHRDLEAAKFAAADVNKNGFLEIEELPSMFYAGSDSTVAEVGAAELLKQKDENGDGKLTPKEFWTHDGEDFSASDEQQADFAKLDLDKDGTLNQEELKSWESGRFHTEEAMKTMVELADKDGDMHVTALELDDARAAIVESDAHYHMMEWAEHHEL